MQPPRSVGEVLISNSMTVYIAGKITGQQIDFCKNKFLTVESLFREHGLKPINPFKLGCPDSWTFKQCKPFNFKAIRQCSAIFMLADYIDSPGSLDELAYAKKIHIPIYYQSANDFYQLLEDSKT